MAGGFMGKYCVIDLTRQETEVVELEEDFYKKYLSGYGLGAAIITQRQKAGIDPLAPEAYLGLCSGLLTGTNTSFSGRFMVVGKSPLTGGWGDANSGGFLSREIKRTGYDAVFFTGVSQKPVWVHITDKGVEFKDAGSLWGKDNVETNQAIKNELGDKRAQVASIGVSGEKLSYISGVTTDDGRIAGRSGMGAVMGSKKLKAVSFKGSLKVAVADPDAMKELTKTIRDTIRKSKATDRFTVKFMGFLGKLISVLGVSVPPTNDLFKEVFKTYGTPGSNVYSVMTGDMPIKNWDGVGYSDFTYARALNINPDKVISVQKKKYACQQCPMGCGGIVDMKKGRFAGTEAHKTEYEAWGAFGGMQLVDNFDAIMECNELCNRAGIDTISTGATIAFAVECFERGLIDEEMTGGLKLGWGRSEEMVKLTEMIINREGIGDLLADGSRIAAQKIGNGAEKFAMQAGGQELPMHDSRLDAGFGVSYQVEPTPGRHTTSSFGYAALYNVTKLFPVVKKAIKKTKGKMAKEVKLQAAGTVLMQLINGCGMCHFAPLVALVPIDKYVNAATGWNLSADDYYEIGLRILSLRKAFNVREGLKQEDSRLPDRAIGTEPMTSGPLKGVTIDIDGMQREFYDTVGWDETIGGPTPEKMKELGIDALFG